MSISKDLLLAILSLDAYNQGYGKGINHEKDKIGPATFYKDDASKEAQSAGFYAVAYDTPYGTVISYRGTDFEPKSDLAQDAAHGWPVGGGTYFEPQALLSVDFLDAVQPDDEKGSVILTGHSLGGGLAGFNSHLFGNEAVIFDPMPYLRAVDNLAYYYTREESLLDPINPEIFVDIPDMSKISASDLLIIGGILKNTPFYAKIVSAIYAFSNIITVETAREFARYIYRPSLSPLPEDLYRNGEIVKIHNASGYYMPGEALDTVGFSFLDFNLVRGRSDYPWINKAGLTDSGTNIAHTPGMDANVKLHSMAVLVLQLYSDQNGHSEKWLPIHKELFQAWFSEDIAKLIDPDDKNKFPEGFSASTVLTMIAYSALDEGGLVFGDTAIRALFDDADELGQYYAKGPYVEHLVEMVVQAAGDQALKEREKQDASNAVKGVVFHGNDYLVISTDLQSIAWEGSRNSGKIVGLERLREALLKDVGSSSRWSWLDRHSDKAELVVGHIEGKNYIAVEAAISRLASEGQGSRWSLLKNTKTPTSIVLGWDIDEMIDGGKGDDLVVAGGGKDILISSEGNDSYWGGKGIDLISYGGEENGITIKLVKSGYPPSRRSFDREKFYNDFEIRKATGGQDRLLGVERIFATSHDDALVVQSLYDKNDYAEDRVNAGAGMDTLDMSALKRGVFVHFDDAARQRAGYWNGDYKRPDFIGEVLNLANFENVIGTPRNDFLNVISTHDGKEWNYIIGGGGRDFIRSQGKTIIFGDTVDGLDPETGQPIKPRDPKHSDNIWWWQNAILADASPADKLALTGFPLVGGTMEVPLVMALLGGFQVGLGYGGLKKAAIDASVNALVSMDLVFFHDNFLPFITYVYNVRTGNLHVLSLFSTLGTALDSAGGLQNALTSLQGQFEKVGATGSPGGMIISNYDFEGYIWGASFLDWGKRTILQQQGEEVDAWRWGSGDLGMKFKLINLATSLWAFAAETMPGAISYAFGLRGYSDDLFYVMDRVTTWVKALLWAEENDPLILDLDGDGIETLSVSEADVHFDIDNDGIAEKVGWLSGDDGFLVLDANGDGRITSVEEMFGGPGQSDVWLKDERGKYVLSPEIGKENRDAFLLPDHHHPPREVLGDELYGEFLKETRPYMNAITGADYYYDFHYSGIRLPYNERDSLVLGLAQHRGSHGDATDLYKWYLDQIQNHREKIQGTIEKKLLAKDVAPDEAATRVADLANEVAAVVYG